MAAGSLVVRISADINAFSKSLDDVTRGVDRAAKKIVGFGAGMTEAITAPVLLMGAAFVKLALDADAAGTRFSRSLGPAAAEVNDQIEKIKQLVPETSAHLQQMATDANNMAKGLGMAAPQAASFSEELLKMGANLSAKTGVGMSETMDALERGLEGSTRGLKGLGIVITEAQIKQEGLRLGLAGVGRELNPLGKGLATYSLLTKQAASAMTDAQRQALAVSQQWAFMKRDTEELATGLGQLLLPVLSKVVGFFRGVVDALNSMPTWLKGAALAFGAMAAAIGPTIILVAKLTTAFVELRAAIALLSAGSALKGFLTLLASPEILLVMAGIALAIGIAAAAWQHFYKGTSKDLGTLLGGLKNVKNFMGGGQTQMDQNPLEEFRKGAEAAQHAFQLALDNGEDMKDPLQRIVDLNKQAAALYAAQADKLGEMALAAADVARQTKLVMAVGGLTKVGYGENDNPKTVMQGAITSASIDSLSNEQLQWNQLAKAIQAETDLRSREIAASGWLIDTYDAVRVAAVEMQERMVDVSHAFQLATESFKQQWQKGNVLQGFTDGLKSGIAPLLAQFTPFGLAMTAVSQIMQGLMPVLNPILNLLTEFGVIIGIYLTPILKMLFNPLKYVGIGLAFLGEVVLRVTAAFATGVGNLLVAIGNAIGKWLGGNAIKRAGQSVLDFAHDQQEAADALNDTQKMLEGLTWEDAANGINTLGSAAKQAASDVVNMSNGFKIELARFHATAPVGTSPGAQPDWAMVAQIIQNAMDGLAKRLGGDTGAAGGGGGLVIQADGKAIAKVVWNNVTAASRQQFGTTARIADVVL